ncbi:hypothetical protein [Bradyrhizobium sp. 2TAF24]|uniref:hypothetical protein n=1 Tax=Bradyrhizobium sp. 2TAF24 TaxID=3233011 RepID=UPI003F8EABB6
MSDGIAGQVSESGSAALEQFTRPGRQAVDFAFELQKACLDEMAQAGDEALERLRSEMEIGAEFIARMACARSVHEIASAFSDCGGHQADVLRRDSERMLRHGQRICERASKLLSGAARQ